MDKLSQAIKSGKPFSIQLPKKSNPDQTYEVSAKRVGTGIVVRLYGKYPILVNFKGKWVANKTAQYNSLDVINMSGVEVDTWAGLDSLNKLVCMMDEVCNADDKWEAEVDNMEVFDKSRFDRLMAGQFGTIPKSRQV